MKKCTHCGKEAPDEATVCPLDGNSTNRISLVDEGGVALAAIQGLNEKLNEKDAQIQKLKSQNDCFEKRLADLEQLVKTSVQK